MKKILFILILMLVSVSSFGQKIHKANLKCDSNGNIYMAVNVENTYINPIVCIIFKVRYNNYQFSYIDKLVKVKVNVPGWSTKVVNFYPPIQKPTPNRILLSRVVYDNGEFTDF